MTALIACAEDEGLRYLVTLSGERCYSCLAPCKEKKDDKRPGPSPAECWQASLSSPILEPVSALMPAAARWLCRVA